MAFMRCFLVWIGVAPSALHPHKIITVGLKAPEGRPSAIRYISLTNQRRHFQRRMLFLLEER